MTQTRESVAKRSALEAVAGAASAGVKGVYNGAVKPVGKWITPRGAIGGLLGLAYFGALGPLSVIGGAALLKNWRTVAGKSKEGLDYLAERADENEDLRESALAYESVAGVAPTPTGFSFRHPLVSVRNSRTRKREIRDHAKEYKKLHEKVTDVLRVSDPKEADLRLYVDLERGADTVFGARTKDSILRYAQLCKAYVDSGYGTGMPNSTNIQGLIADADYALDGNGTVEEYLRVRRDVSIRWRPSGRTGVPNRDDFRNYFLTGTII